MTIASLAWLCLVLGYLARRKRSRHVPLVVAGIGADLGLVLYLQITREAVQTAVSFSLSPLEQIHILFSTLALVLYFPVLYLGIQLIRGQKTSRLLHKRFAVTALIFRTLGFLFMFSMWQN